MLRAQLQLQQKATAAK